MGCKPHSFFYPIFRKPWGKGHCTLILGGVIMKEIHKKNRRWFILAILTSALASISAVAVQFTKGNVLDLAIGGDGAKTIWTSWLLLGLVGLENGMYFLFDLSTTKYNVGVGEDLRKKFFSAFLKESPKEVEEMQQGHYVTGYTKELESVESGYFALRTRLFDIIFKAIIVSLSLFKLDFRVALVTLFLLTLPLYVPRFLEKHLEQAQKEKMAEYQAHLSKIMEWFRGYEILHNFGIKKEILKKHGVINEKFKSADYKQRRLDDKTRTLSALLSYGSHIIILLFVARMVLIKEFSPGDFYIAMGMIDQLSYPIIAISSYLQSYIGVGPIARKLESYFFKAKEGEGKDTLLKDVQELSYENVSYRYQPDQPLIEDFNLSVAKGQRCIITGRSGSGKSTLISLLLDYLKPQKGRVRLDGEDVGELANLSELITIMRQNPIMFQETLRDNLTMFRKMDDEIIFHMLRSLNLDKFANVESLDRQVQENGGNFSGGELKRLSLARTLLRDSPVIILDEPLANVDAETVHRIEDYILKITGKLVVVISHQFQKDKLSGFDQVISLTK